MAFNHIRHTITNYQPTKLSPDMTTAPPNLSCDATSEHDKLYHNLITSANINGFHGRVSLMGTCRLARLVALEAWKEDFVLHHVHWHFDEVDDEKLVVGKAAMLKFLEEVIAETRERMRVEL